MFYRDKMLIHNKQPSTITKVELSSFKGNKRKDIVLDSPFYIDCVWYVQRGCVINHGILRLIFCSTKKRMGSLLKKNVLDARVIMDMPLLRSQIDITEIKKIKYRYFKKTKNLCMFIYITHMHVTLGRK